MTSEVIDVYRGRDEDLTHDDGWVPWERRKAQVVKLCKSLWPTSTQYKIQDRIDAGYNEVILMNISSPSVSEDCQGVAIRIPYQVEDPDQLDEEQREKYDQGLLNDSEIPKVVLWRQVIDSVAILQHVAEVTASPTIPLRASNGIKVPRVIAYDTTTKNPLGNQYIILNLIGGEPLEEELNSKHLQGDPEGIRCSLAMEVAEIMNQLRQVKSPYAGSIRASSSQSWPATVGPAETMPKIETTIIPYGADMPIDQEGLLLRGDPVEGISEEFIASGGLTSDLPKLPLKELVSRAWDRRIYQHSKFFPQDGYSVEQFRSLKKTAEEVIDQGNGLDTGEFSLWHGDFFPRNIMTYTGGSNMIMGILDWDDAVYAPTVVSAAAPTWLWISRSDDRTDEDDKGDKTDDTENDKSDESDDDKSAEENESVDGRETDEDETYERANRVPEDPDLQDVRLVYEGIVGTEFTTSGHSYHDILTRRLLGFARVHHWPYYWHGLAEETLQEWKDRGDEDDGGDCGGEKDKDEGGKGELEYEIDELCLGEALSD
jgi:hypothetical protein